MFRGATIYGILIAAGLLHSQSFEVASIKPSGPQSIRNSEGGPGSKDPGRYSFSQATLMDLIAIGYDVQYFQISSKSPLDQQRFDLVATLPPGATKDQFRTMLRNLLTERFHLKAHLESKDFPAYELVVAKSGVKLKESVESSPPTKPMLTSQLRNVGDGTVVVVTKGEQQPVSALARSIRFPEQVQVVDKTGLSGKFDFTLEFSYEVQGALGSNAPASSVPNVFRALEEQLGLRLVSRKVPFPVVVVESIDKMPTDN